MFGIVADLPIATASRPLKAKDLRQTEGSISEAYSKAAKSEVYFGPIIFSGRTSLVNSASVR